MMNKNRFLLFVGMFYCSQAIAVSPPLLCLTGKIELMLPNYKVAFMNAVDLALSQSKINKDVKLKTYFFDNKPLSPVAAYNQMLRDHCSAIVGFEYLSDLLLVMKSQNDDAIPIFTSYASSRESDKFPKNIYIFEPSYDYQSKKMLSFLRNKFGHIKNALVITEIDRADLARYKAVYEKQLREDAVDYDKFDFIGDDEQFEEKLVKFLSGKHYRFVFVLAGAVGSTKVINYMNDHKKIFIGTENFGSSSNQSLYVRLNDKNIHAFSVRNIDLLKRDKRLNEFISAYKDKYGIFPTPLSAYAYDAVTLILKTYEHSQQINNENILKTSYEGVTGISVKNNLFSRSSKCAILSIRKHGFVYEK